MTPPVTDTFADRPAPRYADLFDVLTPEEQKLLPQVKRFFECFEGDRELRENLKARKVTEAQLATLREIGISFDLNELAPVWEGEHVLEQALGVPDADVMQAFAGYPVLNLWVRYLARKGDLYIRQRRFCTTEPSASREYSAWRQRRIAATRSELGSYGYAIDHPALAIELAVGCSVGCYFCAFDAPKLSKIFDYNNPENLELFRSVAQTLRDVLGWSSGHALLYWSTEPADNPHYVDFLREYRDVTGAVLCTATARADEEWVASLLDFYGSMRLPWPRISVLTRSIMYKVHKRFTPEQARDMVMLMQQKDGEEFRTKVPGGRDKMLARLEQYGDLRDLDVDKKPEDLFVAQGSIACVSGFLINLIDRTVKVTSPCYTTPQYRYGYRIFDEASFTDAADFDRVIRDMIKKRMVVEPYPEMPMRLRDDLRYKPHPDGFAAVSRNQVHQCTGSPIYGRLGEMLHKGTMTYEQVCDTLTDVYRYDPIQVAGVIKGLFDGGFLDELGILVPESRRVPAVVGQA